MSERKATFFFGVDLRRLPVNPSEFDPYLGPMPNNDWPEHLTISPPAWEVNGLNPERIFNDFGRAAEKLMEFDVYPIGDASFDGKTRVTLDDGLQPLHYLAVGCLDTHGYRDQYPRGFIGPDYNGHTSHLDGVLPPRQPIHVDSVTVYRNVNGEKFADRRFKLKRHDLPNLTSLD